jgi:ferrous iron transport protein B
MSATAAALPPSPLRIALVGSPNSGKTTLFNALTGATARVGNYPGVTVERREGRLRHSARHSSVLDLPGLYSLSPETPEEVVAVAVLEGRRFVEAEPDVLVCVVDGTTLRRGLGLVAQVLQLDRPTALVVTMIDEVKARGGALDLPQLSRILGIPVVGVVGHRGVGCPELIELLESPERWSRPALLPPAGAALERFEWVDAVIGRIGGTAAFAVVMALLFQSIFTWAVPLMDAIDGGLNALARLSREVLPAGLLTDLWADGVLAGMGSVLVFLPQIVILFTLIHLLEDVGYMARAAFVVDRLMGWVGLQGRCFVSLLSSYACAIPGIMAARTIESPRDRLATILVAPFMTCSARLPVYTLLIAAFVPAQGGFGPLGLQALVLLALYVLGVVTALATAALLKSSVLRGTPSTFYMELPPYRLPTPHLLASQIWGSASAFLKRAGTLILAVSIVLWALLAFPRAAVGPDGVGPPEARSQVHGSLAAHIGRAIEPVIEPLGFDWKIGVGLVASLAAREVIVATLGQIYAVGDDDFDGLRSALRNDRDPATGRPTFTLATALSLLVFFVFALQCTSTIVVMARETGSWRWPALAFGYMLGLAYGASFLTYRVASALL